MKMPFRELRLHWGLVELVKAPQRLHEGSAKAPRRFHEGSVKQPWWRRGGAVDFFLYNLSSNPNPNPKIKTTHACAEGVTDSL